MVAAPFEGRLPPAGTVQAGGGRCCRVDWSDEQTEGWQAVTRAVHDAGGRIVLQLWHVGRISDPSFLDGEPPVSASAIAARGHVSLLRPERPYPVPRALATEEIPGIIAAYRQGVYRQSRPGCPVCGEGTLECLGRGDV